MNVTTHLQKIAAAKLAATLAEADETLDSVREHLDTENNKDQQMLGFFGTYSVVKSEKQKQAAIQAMRDRGLVSENDVRRVCMHYALRCLPSKQYKKGIPLKVLNTLRVFQEKHRLSEYQMREGLFVIAPVSHFELGPKPQKDPVLLYRWEDGFEVIDTWGADFSFARRLFGWFMCHPVLYLFMLLLPVSWWLTAHIGRWWILSFPVSGLIVLVTAGLLTDDDISESSHRHRWNKRTK